MRCNVKISQARRARRARSPSGTSTPALPDRSGSSCAWVRCGSWSAALPCRGSVWSGRKRPPNGRAVRRPRLGRPGGVSRRRHLPSFLANGSSRSGCRCPTCFPASGKQPAWQSTVLPPAWCPAARSSSEPPLMSAHRCMTGSMCSRRSGGARHEW